MKLVAKPRSLCGKIVKKPINISEEFLTHQSVVLVDLHGLGTVRLRRDGAQVGVQHVDGTVEELVIRRV